MNSVRSVVPGHGVGRTARPAQPVEHSDDQLAAAQEQIEQLSLALVSRATIDQAKGLVMGHYQVSADGAFELLAGWSQDSNVKVRVLAESLVAAAVDGTLRDELTHMGAVER